MTIYMEWKTIRNFSKYQISEYGSVQNIKTGKILKYGKDKDGYLRTSLINDDGVKKEHRIHQTVADTFIRERPKGQIIAHNNGNKLDNHYSNLRFATHAENMFDKIAHGTSLKGRNVAGKQKLSSDNVQEIRELLSLGILVKDIAQRFSVARSTISMIKSGKNWANLS